MKETSCNEARKYSEKMAKEADKHQTIFSIDVINNPFAGDIIKVDWIYYIYLPEKKWVSMGEAADAVYDVSIDARKKEIENSK